MTFIHYLMFDAKKQHSVKMFTCCSYNRRFFYLQNLAVVKTVKTFYFNLI